MIKILFSVKFWRELCDEFKQTIYMVSSAVLIIIILIIGFKIKGLIFP